MPVFLAIVRFEVNRPEVDTDTDAPLFHTGSDPVSIYSPELNNIEVVGMTDTFAGLQ